MSKLKPTTVEEYIEMAPIEAQEMLHELRSILHDIAPNASESLKWGVPVFEQGRILFSYAAYKSHINFMPTKTALVPFLNELSEFKMGKDTIQFPFGKPLPQLLIRKIASYRLKQVKDHGARWRHKND